MTLGDLLTLDGLLTPNMFITQPLRNIEQYIR